MNPSNKTPSQKRVAAGRLNRAKRKGLSPEGAERLRQAALLHQPWLHATGPRTAGGRERSAANGLVRAKAGESVNAVRREVAVLHGLFTAMIGARRALSAEGEPAPGE